MDRFEVIVIGAGPAGVSSAMVLARAGKKVLLVERGDKAGDKNVFGGTIYAQQTADIFPDFWKSAPLERSIVEQKIFMLTDTNSSEFSYKYKKDEHKAFSIIRSKWDNWAVSQVVDAGAYYAPKTLVKQLIIEDGKVLGVQTEFEKIYSDIVIIADGVNSIFAKQIGLRNDIKDKDVSLSVKEVIELPKERIEDRFNLDDETGCACKILGGPLKNKMALGFMYTNKNTVSIGFSMCIDDFKKCKLKPYEVLEQLKSHPTISAYIKGGKVIEYSSHLLPEGGYNAIPKLYDNRVMIVGDAGMLVNNIHFEGTNLAMLSGKLAAETAIDALDRQDCSASTLKEYYKKLQNSIVIKDMRTHKNTISTIKKNISTITSLYPELACQFFDIMSSADCVPKRAKYRKFLATIIKKAMLPSIPLFILAMEKCFKK
ncbi:FAD-dependent oxidoreductase [bacterium]|nr:FAD-dependent oxidoreductase [bacterium]